MISIRDCFSSFLLYFSDANNEDFHRRIAQLQSEVSALSNARANLAFERDTLQTEKQMLISAHDAKVKEVDGELSAMLVHLTEVTEEAAANEERVHNLTAKTYALEQIASTKDREIASLRASLDAANAQSSDNVQQLRGEMVQKEQEVLQLLDSVARARRGKPFATTRLDAPANAGSSELVCNVPARCLSGMLVVIGDGNDNEEERHIVGFASILVDHPLSHAHPVGTIVTIYDPNQLVHTSNLAAVTTELQEQRQQLAQVEIQLREQAAEYQRYQDEADRATLATLAQHSAQVEDFQCLLARSYEERDKITAGNVEYQRQLATTQIANVEASVVAEERDKLRRELERTKTSLADVTSEFQTYQEQMMRSVGEAKMTQIRESAVSEQLRNEVEDLQRQVAIHVSEVDRVTAEREALQKEKDAMGRDTDAELQKLRVRLAEMTMSLAALQSEKQMLASLHDAKVKEVDGELSAMLVHLTEVTEEAAANEERVHNLTAKTYALEQIASTKDREIASLRASLDAANAQSSDNVQQLRGEMVQKEQEVLQLLDSVARARRGKPFATTRLDAPANAGSSELVCNVPARCLSGMLVVIGDGNDNEEERHIVGFASILVDHPLSHAHPVGTIVTIYDPNQLALASHSKDAATLQNLKAECHEKNDNIALLTSKIGEIEKQIDTYSTMAAAKAADKSNARREIEAMKQRLANANDENAALSKKCGDIQASGIAGKAARDKLILELETKLASHSKDAAALRDLQAECCEKDDNIALLTSKIGEIEKQIVAMAMAKADAIDGRREIEAMKQQLEFLIQQIDKAREENQRMSARSALNKDEIASLHQHLDEANQQLDAQMAENGRLATTITSIRKLEAEAVLEEERRISDLESRHMVCILHSIHCTLRLQSLHETHY